VNEEILREINSFCPLEAQRQIEGIFIAFFAPALPIYPDCRNRNQFNRRRIGWRDREDFAGQRGLGSGVRPIALGQIIYGFLTIVDFGHSD